MKKNVKNRQEDIIVFKQIDIGNWEVQQYDPLHVNIYKQYAPNYHNLITIHLFLF